MIKNVGSIDKTIRFILAVVFILLVLFADLPIWLNVILIILAVAFVITSSISFCPIYLPFKINTSKVKETVE